MKRMHWFALCAALVAGAAWAQKKGDLQIDAPWARATPPGASVAGGYVSVRNRGAAPDKLVAASSPAAEHVELHVMSMQGNVMRMQQVKQFDVPAHGELALKPGGNHLMFIGLKEPFKEGTKIPVKLRFEKAGEVEVQLSVGAMGASAPMQMPMHK
ncbi:MAG TPA: copper chaperone PCu(A)C [Burkholderiales bacterium]|nr:copper chaperone PCu(A)C [Burkholderiales bacterium]